MDRLARIVVLISGSGSNLQAVINACEAGQLKAHVVLVVSNRPEAYGLERAARACIPTLVVEKTKDQDRRAYDRALADQVAVFAPDIVLLAGWMRLLSSDFLERFSGRVINLHPALPGALPGTHAIQRAFEASQRGEIRQTGVMVHYVPDEGVDSGPVIAQQAVEIHPDDSLETLEARVHAAEHRLLVQALGGVVDAL
jgi:phosphoribosylglycinamide formyltransferase 1